MTSSAPTASRRAASRPCRQRHDRQRPAAGADRRPVPDREPRRMRWRSAQRWSSSTGRLGIGFIYKTSFDKANRTSIESQRGIGLAEGCRSSPRCARRYGCPVLTDVHTAGAMRAGRRGGRRAADPGLPLPPDRSAASPRRATGRPINIKKGQFLAPWDMEQCRAQGRSRPATTRSWSASAAPASATTRWSPTCARCRSWPRPATRWCSTRPIRCSSRAGRADLAAASASSSRSWRAPRSRSASPRSSWRRTRIPTSAPSDGPNMVQLKDMPALLETLMAFDRLAKAQPWRI